MPRGRKQAIRYSNRWWTDIRTIDLKIGAVFGSQETQNTVASREFADGRVLGKASDKLVTKHRDVSDHRGPERINKNGCPHVGHHVACIFVNAGKDLGHRFGCVAAGALIN